MNQDKSRRDLNHNSSCLIPHSSLSLYIHIPFCASKCAYCDFASYPGREGDWARYFEALWAEIDGWKPELDGYETVTVFIGGGTPTLVPAEYIVETMDRARALLPFAADAEMRPPYSSSPATLFWRAAVKPVLMSPGITLHTSTP